MPLVTAFSLWVGSAIYPMRSKLRSFFRCVFYLPVVTGSVAVTVVWKWMFNPYNGLLNQIFRHHPALTGWATPAPPSGASS